MPLRSMMPLNLSWDPIVEADDDIEHDIILHQSESDLISPALWAVRKRQCLWPLTINHHDVTVSILLTRALMGSYAGSIHDELWGLVLGAMIINLGSYVWLLSFGILFIPYSSRDLSSWRRRSSKLYKSSAWSSCFSFLLWLRDMHVQYLAGTLERRTLGEELSVSWRREV